MAQRLALACAFLGLATVATAGAQTPTSQTTQPAATTTPSETRPATTTFWGDTGLWFVPTGEILGDRRWSLSGYRANFDREQGFTDLSHFAVTVGVGLRDRVELFGSWRVDTRIDRDIRPLFTAHPEAGGVVNEYPLVRQGWSGDRVGDLVLGVKINLLAEHRQEPAAVAVRGMVKVPTGDDDGGVSTGKADVFLDAIVSKEVNERVELAGFGGLVFRADPSDVDVSHGFRWGVGAGFPTRRPLRLFTELHGEFPFDDEVTTSGSRLVATDGSRAPALSHQNRSLDATLGLIWQHANGVFVGAGVNYAFGLDGREDFGAFTEETGDSLGFQFRIGYHPGVRVYVPPPAPPPPPPPPPPANRPPTVKARCEPCVLQACSGQTSTVTGDAQDPDGDALTYRWSAPTGKFANPNDRQTQWTPPCEPGSYPTTVTVDDRKGGTASDTVTIQVVPREIKQYTFEDVHFDFDRYTLRPEAIRVLDEVVTALKETPELRVEVEGHTCNIGTAEYNLALGERRAHAVRDYLTSRSVGADRLRTVSYGEEKPKHDNAREETRRLNRRAALVVRIQR